MNLLEETKEFLKTSGKSLDDIKWWGSRRVQLPLNKLSELLNVEYDNGFGSQEIEAGLILVGDDFWLSREEYDGSECWRFNTFPKCPIEFKEIDTVKCDSWEHSL